jgi:RNA-binding protein
VVQIGKLGVTDALRAQIDGALGHHELIKVKVGAEAPLDRFEAADQLAANAGPQVAQILGRAILLYRRHPEHPKFEK